MVREKWHIEDAWIILCGNCSNILRVEPDLASDQVMDGALLDQELCNCGAPVDGERQLTEWTP